MFKLKNSYEEALDHLDTTKRERTRTSKRRLLTCLIRSTRAALEEVEGTLEHEEHE